MRKELLGFLIVSILGLGGATGPAQAQSQPAGTVAPPSATQSPAPAGASNATLLTAGQLQQLVAPIALYPDELLADVLMAATYPIEIVEADRWLDAHKNLTGTALTSALAGENWHASVKSLVATPSVLTMMNDQLGWTQQLGTAVIAQQPDVMNAVQILRAEAKAQNQLDSTKEQNVTVEQQAGKEVIVIEPAVPGTIYVPYYNPAAVYGPWAYPAYPPYYWPPPAGYALAAGVAFGVGYAIGASEWHGYWGGYWGGCDWGHGNITVNRTVNVNGDVHVNVNNWQHDVNDRSTDFSNAFRGDSDSFSDAARQQFDTFNRSAGPGASGFSAPGDGGGFNRDAFGSFGGYRSDFRSGGFRGGSWGGRFGGGFGRR